MKSRCSDYFSMSRYHINSPASKPCEVSAVSPFLQCPEALAEVRPPLPLSGHSIVYPVSDSLEISANEPPKSSPQSPIEGGRLLVSTTFPRRQAHSIQKRIVQLQFLLLQLLLGVSWSLRVQSLQLRSFKRSQASFLALELEPHGVSHLY